MILYRFFQTFLSLILTIALFYFFALIIESAGNLEVNKFLDAATKKHFTQISYVKDATMIITRFLNIFAFIWFTCFIFNCQDFVIAGAASKWFFSRVKSNLGFPLLESLRHLIRYHLGSISLGSLILAIIRMIKLFVSESEVSHQIYKKLSTAN